VVRNERFKIAPVSLEDKVGCYDCIVTVIRLLLSSYRNPKFCALTALRRLLHKIHRTEVE
jgi:hypothetical protein